MKGRVILIDHSNVASMKSALLVDGRLEDLAVSPAVEDPSPLPGAIYLGKVDRLIPAANAAFVAIGPETTGYLRDAKGLKSGATLLVQVEGHADPGKAPTLSRRLIVKGTSLILTVGAPGINVSRSIRKPEIREQLKDEISKIVAEFGDRWPSQYDGLIVRTCAADRSDQSLRCEVDELLEHRRLFMDAAAERHAPGPVGGWVPHVAAYTEWAADLPERVFYRGEEPYDDFKFDCGPAFCDARMRKRLDESNPDPFDHFGVWDEIERLKSPRADFPSGGWMAIEATRAMVTVDVNTGDQFSAGAAMTANIEAARELPRQLRLRGLGGQVIVDFAPLKKMHRKRIEETLKAAFRRDPVATTLAGWTPLGNFELQRKRERRPLSALLSSPQLP